MVEGHVGSQTSRRRARSSLSYLAWMDGLRAVAVLAVMVYHEMIVQPGLGIQNKINGGLLGVDIFFAISGFLITTLLLQEARDRGAIRFGAFYVRRARRLLPALGGLLLVVTLVALVGEGGHHRISTLEHVGITAGYVANWVQALGHNNLRELSQTWSLAIEEQFYLIWPAMLAGLIFLARRRSNLIAVGVAAVAVVTVGWTEFSAYRHWGANRLYYGLDTRAASLAFGAVLGALFVGGLLPRSRLAVRVRRIGAVVGVLVIIVLLHNAGQPGVYAINLGITPLYANVSVYALTALATTLILWELLEAKPHLGHRLLSWPPLVAVGRISYGLYLWDGTLIVWMTPESTGIHGWPLVILHVATAFAAATASWFVIEQRFRSRRREPTGGGQLAVG